MSMDYGGYVVEQSQGPASNFSERGKVISMA